MEADNLDRAATLTQKATDRQIKAIRGNAAKIDTANPSGECWFCAEPIGTDRRWCNADCRNLYEKDNND